MNRLSDDPYLPLIQRVAGQLRRRLPRSVEVGDLISDGYVGLHAARRRLDPARADSFRFFAVRWIRGAMLDGLRQRDPLPRKIRESDCPPWILPLKDCAVEDRSHHDLLMVNQIDRLLASLTDRTWLVLQLYYFEHFSMKQIGKMIGLTEGGVSLMFSRTMQLLRTMTEPEHEK